MTQPAGIQAPQRGHVGVEPAIVAREVRESYGALRAVDGLSLTVERGEIFALLGPNGAGKTTMVEILEGYRRPDAGEVRVLGLDPIHQGTALKQRMGLMMQATALYEKIKVREALELFCGYYEHPRDPGELLRMVGLEGAANSYFENLSGGQKQRLSLGLALAGNAELVFLDEPTAGMDPQARLQTWEIIETLRRQEVTVLLTTHYMEEAQRLADHVAIIDHGRLIALGTPEELMRSSASEVVRFKGPPNLDIAGLTALPRVLQAIEERDGSYMVSTSCALDTAEALAAWRRAAGIELSDLRITGATLEEVFLRLTGEEVRD